MITRKIGKVLRGKTTPLQIALASILGSMIGFVPGFAQGPGWLVTLVLLLIVLNANLGIAVVALGLAKIASLALMPVSFGVGRVLMDGPTQPIFKMILNTPVLALMGFEHYATTGGAVVGLIVGGIFAVAVIQFVQRFRKKIASLEEGSERYRKISGSWWSRALVFIFIGGGHGKKTYDDLLQKKIGNPIRPVGVVLAVLVVVLLVVVQRFAAEPILTSQLTRALERANGATVDLERANLDLKKGKLTLEGLAMADPNALGTDVFRAVRLEADVSGADLLTKRLALDSVVIVDGSSGSGRRIPGHLVGRSPHPAPAPPTGDTEKTIDDYIKQAQMWKQRLAQVRRWLERIGKSSPDEDGTGTGETLGERLAREVREKGYARVTADHLIEGAPLFLIRTFSAQGVTISQVEGEVLDISGVNLCTQPWLVEEGGAIAVSSQSGKLAAKVGLGSSTTGIDVHLHGLDADTIGAQLAVQGQPPMSGGTVDLDLSGSWGAQGVGTVDLPLKITLNDTTLTLPASGQSAKVDTFVLPVALRGPIDNPAITLDNDMLADALVKAGAGALAKNVQGKATKAIDDALGEQGKGVAGEAGKAIKGLLGGKKRKK